MITRLAIRTSTLGAIADSTDPRIKVIPATMLVQRRPILSEAVPPASAPNNAPKVTALTTSPCWPGPRWKSGTMNSIAPAITPVSKPNKRPPSADRGYHREVQRHSWTPMSLIDRDGGRRISHVGNRSCGAAFIAGLSDSAQVLAFVAPECSVHAIPPLDGRSATDDSEPGFGIPSLLSLTWIRTAYQ